MREKFWCVLVVVLCTAGCSHQAKQQTASNPSGGQAAAATAPAPAPVANASPAPMGNPEPVERPPVEAVVPAEPARPSALGPAASTWRSSAPSRPSPPVPAVENTAPMAAAVIIPAGTRIRVRLGQTLDSKHSRTGERFVAYLAAPVVTGDRIIVPRGTEFEGSVVEAKPSGRLRGRAYLGIRLDSFRLHGRTYEITTAADFRSSRSHKKRNFAIIGGSTGTGAAIGAVGGGIGAAVGAGVGAAVGTTGAFISGRKNVKLPVETPLVFSLRGAVAVRG
ncbi:MAG TPA: hypothetical protein VME43_12885 [Bryobacteraceae bacterium]|nr:hypothetical protein [Bryobacteraceae bacterium]